MSIHQNNLRKKNDYSAAQIIPMKVTYLSICTMWVLDTYISEYNNIMLLGDLNVTSADPVLKYFCDA